MWSIYAHSTHIHSFIHSLIQSFIIIKLLMSSYLIRRNSCDSMVLFRFVVSVLHTHTRTHTTARYFMTLIHFGSYYNGRWQMATFSFMVLITLSWSKCALPLRPAYSPCTNVDYIQIGNYAKSEERKKTLTK